MTSSHNYISYPVISCTYLSAFKCIASGVFALLVIQRLTHRAGSILRPFPSPVAVAILRACWPDCISGSDSAPLSITAYKLSVEHYQSYRDPPHGPRQNKVH